MRPTSGVKRERKWVSRAERIWQWGDGLVVEEVSCGSQSVGNWGWRTRRETEGFTGRDKGGTDVDRSGHGRGLNGALAGGIPAVFLARREDELGVRVCGYEFGDEGAGGQVADRLAVAEKLVPLLFAEGCALVFEFGEEGLTPEVDVRRVFEEAVHMVCVIETELLEGNTYCCPRD